MSGSVSKVRWNLYVSLLAAMVLAGCDLDGSNTSANPVPTTNSAAASSTSAVLTISGSPAPTVVAGSTYGFTPTVSGTQGYALNFSIQNKPDWASFNTTTGALTGTPSAANVGIYSNIVISASNGSASTALAAFGISVTQMGTGTATLSWSAPDQNTDGSALTNLSGYRIYYGTDAQSLTQSVNVDSAGITTYVVTNLGTGTWYFAISAYNAAGVESNASNIASKTIS